MTRRLPDGRVYHRHSRREGQDYWHAHHMANGDKSAYRHPISEERAHPPARSLPYPVRQGPPDWFLEEAARQGTPDPVAPYDRLDLRVDPAPRPYPRPGDRLGDDDHPRSGWIIAWLAAIAIIATVALLIATRSAAPRSAPDPTAPLPGASGTDVVSDGAVLAQVQVSASGPRPSGAPGRDVFADGWTDTGAPPPPATLDPRVGREGVITHMGDDHPWPIDYLAIPLGPGRWVRICGPAACRDMVSTDAGPSRGKLLEGVIADVSWQRFEMLCGVPARMGRCSGSWIVMTSSTANVTPPPTDVGP